MDDVELATLVGHGDAAAFEALYDRHHASLLAFCRHMLGNREDGEDALQQAFVRAHAALVRGRPPAAVRAWLFAIARNRCLTMLAARKNLAVPAERLPESGVDDLAEHVRRRAELRELVADLGELPDDQRAALVLAEIGDLSHPEIAAVLECPPKKVKALVFQAREALVANRDARCIPCTQIRGQLETANGNALRRAALRRHLRQCEPCDAYRLALHGRGGLGALLPVAPTAGLKAAVLGGLWGGDSAAAAMVAGAGAGAGAASGGGAAGLVAGAGVKTVLAKVAVTAAVAGAGVSGGAAAVHEAQPDRPPATPAATRVAAAPTAGATPRATQRVRAPQGAAAAQGVVAGRGVRRLRRAAVRARIRRARLARSGRPRAGLRRQALRAQRRTQRVQVRRRARARLRAGVAPRTVRPGGSRPFRRRALRPRLLQQRPPPVPTATPTPAVPTATPEPTATTEPSATPTPAATP